MKKTITHIAPLQLGKILGILYGFMSLLIIPFILLGAIGGALAESGGNVANTAVAGGIILAIAVFLPVIYAIMGFLTGVIGAWLYNIVTKWVGGMEIEFADDPPQTAQTLEP